MVQTRRSLVTELNSKLRRGRILNPEKKKKLLLKRFKEAQMEMKASILKRKQRQQRKKLECSVKTKKIKKNQKKQKRRKKIKKHEPFECYELIQSISKKNQREQKLKKSKKKITKKINKEKRSRLSKKTRTQSAKKMTPIAARKKKRTSLSAQKKLKSTSLNKNKRNRLKSKNSLFEEDENDFPKVSNKKQLSPVKEKSEIAIEARGIPVLGLMDLIPIKHERVVVPKQDKSAGYMGAGEEIREESSEESEEEEMHNPNILGFHDLLKSFTHPVKRDCESSDESEVESRKEVLSVISVQEEEEEEKQEEEVEEKNILEEEAEEEENMLEEEEQKNSYKDAISFGKSSTQKENVFIVEEPSQEVEVEDDLDSVQEENSKPNCLLLHELKEKKYDNVIVQNGKCRKISFGPSKNELPIRKGSLNLPQIKNEVNNIDEKKIETPVKPIISESSIMADKENINNSAKKSILKEKPEQIVLENKIEEEVIQEPVTIKEETCQIIEEKPVPQVENSPKKITKKNEIIEEIKLEKIEEEEEEELLLETPKKQSKIKEESARKTKSKKYTPKKTKSKLSIDNLLTKKNLKKLDITSLSAQIRSKLDYSKNKPSIPQTSFNLMNKPSFSSSIRVSKREKFQDLLAPRIIIPLSSSLNRLLSKFKLLSVNVNIFGLNRQTPFFSTLRKSIYNNYKEIITTKDLQKMLYVFKFCFHLEWAFNSKLDDYDIILSFPKKIANSGAQALNSHLMQQMYSNPQENTCPNSKSMHRSLSGPDMSDRLATFRKKLVKIVGVYHNKFLDNNKLAGSSFQGEFAKTWHCKFKLEEINDSHLISAKLPPKPKKVSIEEIRREKLHEVLGSSAREQMHEIDKKIRFLQKECLKTLDSRENTSIFNDFEKDKYTNKSTSEEDSLFKKSSIETIKKNSTMASASASHNYISNTLKWKNKFKFLTQGQSASAATHIVEDSSMKMNMDSEKKFEQIRKNIEELVFFIYLI
jgi:hypothetical protein